MSGLRTITQNEWCHSAQTWYSDELGISYKWHGFGLEGQRSMFGLTAIRRGFELYECLLVIWTFSGFYSSNLISYQQCHAEHWMPSRRHVNAKPEIFFWNSIPTFPHWFLLLGEDRPIPTVTRHGRCRCRYVEYLSESLTGCSLQP